MPAALLADVIAIERPVEHAVAAQAAIDSCNMVLGQGRCYAATLSGVRPTWYAVVAWDAVQPLQASVEVRRHHHAGPLLVVRQVDFAANDSLEQRYRAIGLLIVSHVVAEASREQHAVFEAEDAFWPGRSQPSWSWGIDVLGVTGTGVQGGVPRFGAFVRPWIVSDESAWRGFLRLGWATHAGKVDVQWYDAALGLGLAVNRRGPLLAELRVAALVQQVSLHAFNRSQGSDSAAVPRWGARLGFEAGWVASESLSVLLGVEAAMLSPGYTLDVEAARVGEERAPIWSAVLGLRIEP